MFVCVFLFFSQVTNVSNNPFYQRYYTGFKVKSKAEGYSMTFTSSFPGSAPASPMGDCFTELKVCYQAKPWLRPSSFRLIFLRPFNQILWGLKMSMCLHSADSELPNRCVSKYNEYLLGLAPPVLDFFSLRLSFLKFSRQKVNVSLFK